MGELPGRARAAAPRPPPTASPTPCRGTRHPSSTQGSTRLPGRMLQGNGPAGPPNKVCAGWTRTVGGTVLSAGPRGEPVAPALPPVLVRRAGRDGAMPHPATVKRLFSLLSSCLSFPGVALGARAPWPGCGAVSATPCWKRRWQRQPRGFPGHPVLGTGAGWGDSGDGRGQCAPRSWGLPPHGGWELGAPRLGGTVTTAGMPRRRFFHPVSPCLWRGARGGPLALLQRCCLCAALLPWTVAAHPRSRPTLSPTTEPLYDANAARLGSKPASRPPSPP